ncbi:hypothetical protein D9M71_659060 [compost metagenome]
MSQVSITFNLEFRREEFSVRRVISCSIFGEVETRDTKGWEVERVFGVCTVDLTILSFCFRTVFFLFLVQLIFGFLWLFFHVSQSRVIDNRVHDFSLMTIFSQSCQQR